MTAIHDTPDTTTGASDSATSGAAADAGAEAAATGQVSLVGRPGDQAVTILIDRPDKLNALTLPMLDQLDNHLYALDKSDTRVVKLRSAGQKVFSVGADISQFSKLTPVGMWNEWIKIGHRIFDRLANLRQPTIAVVDGHAFGGGLELALACDLRILGTGARLSLPETSLGTIPGWGGTARLTELVGRSRAKEMILARRQILAPTALDWGLVNVVAAPEDLDAEVDRLLADITGGAPLAQQLAKQLIDAAANGGDARILEAIASGFSASSRDYRRGVEAFLARDTPRFEGN